MTIEVLKDEEVTINTAAVRKDHKAKGYSKMPQGPPHVQGRKGTALGLSEALDEIHLRNAFGMFESSLL